MARMISALLREPGLTVGTYTSPHLQRINERLEWNLEPISDPAFAEIIGELARSAIARNEPCYFELLTAAAFTWFAKIAVDVAVVEVGIFGRYDATNVIDGIVAVITNVGQDHTDLTGDWRVEIAPEKAGIIKPISNVVIGEDDPDLRPIYQAEGPGRVIEMATSSSVRIRWPSAGAKVLDTACELQKLYIPLYGSHQADNAAMALVAAEAFFGRELAQDTVNAAFAAITLPGRFEIVRRGPLVILDGAHNPGGAVAEATTFDEEFDVGGSTDPGGRAAAPVIPHRCSRLPAAPPIWSSPAHRTRPGRSPPS